MIKKYPTYGRHLLRRQIRGLRSKLFKIKRTGELYSYVTDRFPGYINQMDALADQLLDELYYRQEPRKRKKDEHNSPAS